MAENEPSKRPVRKLTVDNFSVIKHAELEFGKITVLIGPQASGKSLLCKLAYFLSKQVIEQALIAILSPNPPHLGTQGSFQGFVTSVKSDFLTWFPLDTWRNEGASVALESHLFHAHISLGNEMGELDIRFSPEFESLFANLIDLAQQTHLSGAEYRRNLADQVRARFYLLATESSIDRPVYIPDGRAFFSNQSLGFTTVNNPDIDPVLKEFSLQLSWGSPRSPNPILGDEGVRVLERIHREIIRIAGGSVEGRNGLVRFKRASDRKSIPLPLLSSGTQALLPMLNVVWQMIVDQRDRIIFPRPDNLPGMPKEIVVSKGLVYLEEPEANIFPATAYDIVRLLTWISHEWRLDFSWVITTHSPYILSSFNNLIEAGQAARNNPMLHDEVAKIIPEQYWIKEGDFKAYAIEDGNLKSILNESGFIESNYLDQVSEVIGDEFDKLLRLEYEHTKAS